MAHTAKDIFGTVDAASGTCTISTSHLPELCALLEGTLDVDKGTCSLSKDPETPDIEPGFTPVNRHIAARGTLEVPALEFGDHYQRFVRSLSDVNEFGIAAALMVCIFVCLVGITGLLCVWVVRKRRED